jgi:glycosyltransferase involved in cell wall biosynthesis
MKILHADTDDLGNPLRGGQPVRTFEVNSRLAARHDITVLTATYRGAQRRQDRGSVHYRRLGVRVPGWGLSMHLSFLASLGWAVRSLPHDLVVEEFTPPIGFCQLPRWTSKPVVSIVQWFFFRDWERRYKMPFERWMRGVPKRVPYRNFIVQTERMGNYFRQLIPEARVWVVPCGVGDDMFQTDRGGDYVLFLGRLDVNHKGLDLLLDVWARLCAQGRRIPLHIAGAGPARALLEQRVQKAGMDDVVRFLGRVEGPAKLELLRGCRFMAMPSRQETFGISAIEAMASSKPVVAFDIDHLNEVLDPRWALKVPAFDTSAYADAVSRLWSAPEHCLVLGEAAFRAADRNRWSRIALNQEQIYQSVVLDCETTS